MCRIRLYSGIYTAEREREIGQVGRAEREGKETDYTLLQFSVRVLQLML